MDCTGESRMMESNPNGTFNVPNNDERVHPIFTGGLLSVFFDHNTEIRLTKPSGQDNVHLPDDTPITCLNLYSYIDDLDTVT